MLLADTCVVLGAMSVLVFGVKKGLERAVMIMFPLLLILLIALLGFAIYIGHFAKAVQFLFYPDFKELTSKTILLALGQAFFSLNVAMGVTLMFSAYLPEKSSVVKNTIAIAIADTGFALLSGLIIFPIVFAFGLKPGAGPSLIFQTLPIAFGQMPGGRIISTLFFMMLFFAAFSSVVAIMEPSTAWLMEHFKLPRKKAVLYLGIIMWVLSLGTVGSFSHPHYFSLFKVTFFQGIDYLTASIMLPVGGLLLAIYAGWKVKAEIFQEGLGWNIESFWFKLWRFNLRYFAPAAIFLILLTSTGIL